MPGIVATEFAAHALGGTPAIPSARGGPIRVQSAEEVAEQIASLIRNPVAELYTSPGLAEMVSRYYQDVAAFEESLG